MMKQDTEAGIFIKVTEKFTEHLDESLQKRIIQELRDKGYKIDRSVITRFGILLTLRNPDLLEKNLDLLLAASSAQSTTAAIEQEKTS